MNVYFFIQLAATFVIMLCALYLGFELGRHRHQSLDVKAYIRNNFPNEWTAYQRGVTEGYEQGLRDGQEFPLL